VDSECSSDSKLYLKYDYKVPHETPRLLET
jgi:hypothetical protein